jgi:CRISPR-associated endonuclease Csn1
LWAKVRRNFQATKKMGKKILGLDLGTNSIGWAVISKNDDDTLAAINGLGSRIIPMSQDILGNFDAGNSVSQTAERTGFRGTRRMRERFLLRRERLHRVLHLLKFLPEHYEKYIDFDKRPGQFVQNAEPKLPWKQTTDGKPEFLFQKSFDEMLADFAQTQPQLLAENKKIPYDWTIYYLRKKAVSEEITKEELAWILLNFNQKRGYYQLRGEDDERTDVREYCELLKIVSVEKGEKDKKNDKKTWYKMTFENGWEYSATFTTTPDWLNLEREFLITEELDENGNIKIVKDKKSDTIGKEKRRITPLPSFDEINLMSKKDQDKIYKKIKARTEVTISNSGKTVGVYIYDTLLQNPNQKIRGQLIRTIERNFYKSELERILKTQVELQPDLFSKDLYSDCVRELYKNNKAHRSTLNKRDFVHLFVDDIIFYQRPLRSQKSLISNCPYEFRTFKNENNISEKAPVKCIAKSNPYYQEFRLWQFIQNLKIKQREKQIDENLQFDVDVTEDFLPNDEKRIELFEWLNKRKNIKQDVLLASFFKVKKTQKSDETLPYRWNYVEDKEYPCNETRAEILNKFSALQIPADFLTKEKEMALWHILYSFEGKEESKKVLAKFAKNNGLNEHFAETMCKIQRFDKEYGAYSEKAIKKLLPLMRMGPLWNENDIAESVKNRIDSIYSRLKDINFDKKKLEIVADDDVQKPSLKSFVKRYVAGGTKPTSHYSGLSTEQACYAVYGHWSESGEIQYWKTPQDIENYLKKFKQHSLRNPIVEQVVIETLRVVKDIWEKYGYFSEIHIELGREMKKPADLRAFTAAQITENENANMRIKALLTELKNNSDGTLPVENVLPYSLSQQEILKIYEDGVLNSASEIPDEILKIIKQSQPTKSELIRYKLWLEQKYRSPYTGRNIPLGKLFTEAYEIEHIIPQSRYFDDSMSNKVICEAEVNKEKGNMLGYEFIKKCGGEKGTTINLSNGKAVKLLSVEAYEDFVKNNFKDRIINYTEYKNGVAEKNSRRLRNSKKEKLLLEEIPDKMINRQMSDTCYISKFIAPVLSNIVREETGDDGVNSKNVIFVNGPITATLRREWGLNDVWNKLILPRFERMNKLTGSDAFTVRSERYRRLLPTVPLALSKGFKKKRIDHRSHPADAVVIACTTIDHVNYLNNKHAKEENERRGLRNKLCIKTKTDSKGKPKWQFKKPCNTFTQDVQAALESVIVSFKQNLRVINKTVNKYQAYENGKKIVKTQTQGESWAIRKPLHKETVFAKVALRKVKIVRLSEALKDWQSIVDKQLKQQIKAVIAEYGENVDSERLNRYFKDKKYKLNDADVSKVQVYYVEAENAATRKPLGTPFTERYVKESVTDTGIQKILLNHLQAKGSNPELAFSPEGIEEMNKNILQLNGGKQHQPIYKVRVYESIRKKFPVGSKNGKQNKYVEAAKGTNLFFAVYADENGNRSYETIPLNTAIARLKQGQSEVPERNDNEHPLLFSLSPNDLVYVPTKEEIESQVPVNVDNVHPSRVYKMVSSSGNQCFFVPNNVASPIMQTTELGANNKSERSWDGTMIKQHGIKITIDRIGRVDKMSTKCR